MPWAAGVYTRGYPSWSADAASNLPISATKFDTEDNDFAAGLNNCLTKDGLSTPNTPMVWGLSNGQVLNLTRGSDGVVFGVARAGGSNNPALQFIAADGTGIGLGYSGTPWMTLVQAGGVTFAQPVAFSAGSGVSAAFQGAANQYAVTVTGSSTVGQSFGELIQAGSNASDISFLVQNKSATFSSLALFGDGHGTLGASASLGLSWSTTGAVSINSGSSTPLSTFITAPGNIITARDTSNSFQLTLGDTAGYAFLDASNATNGLALTTQGGTNARLQIGNGGAVVINIPTAATALSVNGAASQHTAVLVGNSSVGGSFGLLIEAGTNSSDAAFEILNQAASLNYFRVFGDGGCLVGAPTGGTLGAGTLNIASTLAINNQPVYAGIPQNSQVGAYVTVLADANKHIYQPSGGSVTKTIAANASVAYQIGTAITFVNQGSGAMTIAINTDTLIWAANNSTGSRTLAVGGIATALKITSTAWVISGTGLS